MFNLKPILLIVCMGVITPLTGLASPPIEIKNWLLFYTCFALRTTDAEVTEVTEDTEDTEDAEDAEDAEVTEVTEVTEVREKVIITSQINTEEQAARCEILPTLTALIAKPYNYISNCASLDEKTKAEHSWSQDRHSRDIRISQDSFSLYRDPIPQKTDVCIGEQTYKNGLHFWRIKWPEGSRGTYAAIGLASNKVSIFDANRYMNLIGSKELSTHSFGWDIKNNKIISNGNILKSYPEQDTNYKMSDDMALILDMDKKTLGFYDIKNDKYLGDAVTDLKGEWSPAISSVWGECRIYLKYCGDFKKQPLSLQETCKRSINQRLKAHPEKEVQNTNLPKPLQKYLAAPYDSPLDGSDGQAADFP